MDLLSYTSECTKSSFLIQFPQDELDEAKAKDEQDNNWKRKRSKDAA